jgi:hypothetical protein
MYKQEELYLHRRRGGGLNGFERVIQILVIFTVLPMREEENAE